MRARWGLTVWILAVAVIGGCSQTPFPNANLSPVQQPSLPSTANFVLQFENVMEFTEGMLSEYTIQASVPAPGVAQITASGLPVGAVLIAGTATTAPKISWTPPSGAGVDPSNPSSGYREYDIQIVLTSSAVQQASFGQKAVLLVHQPSN